MEQHFISNKQENTLIAKNPDSLTECDDMEIKRLVHRRGGIYYTHNS